MTTEMAKYYGPGDATPAGFDRRQIQPRPRTGRRSRDRNQRDVGPTPGAVRNTKGSTLPMGEARWVNRPRRRRRARPDEARTSPRTSGEQRGMAPNP